MRRILLIFILTLLVNSNFAQTKALIIDSKLNTNSICFNDSITYPDYRDSTGQRKLFLPVNSTVEFKTDNSVESTKLLHCIATKNNDTTTINLTNSKNYSLDIDVWINIKLNKYSIDLFYNTVNIGDVRKLDVKTSELKLNTDKLVRGKKIIGILKIIYSGKVISPIDGDETIINGQCDGIFEVTIK